MTCQFAANRNYVILQVDLKAAFFDMLIPKTHPEMSCVSFHLQLVIQLTLERV